MILWRQSYKQVVRKERHLEIDGCAVFPRSLAAIEGKELLDSDAFAMGSDTLFVPGHRICCEPLPFEIRYDVSGILLFGCSFAIVT
jgi:hypothetical protein